jgi:hypothetical protein
MIKLASLIKAEGDTSNIRLPGAASGIAAMSVVVGRMAYYCRFLQLEGGLMGFLPFTIASGIILESINSTSRVVHLFFQLDFYLVRPVTYIINIYCQTSLCVCFLMRYLDCLHSSDRTVDHKLHS